MNKRFILPERIPSKVKIKTNKLKIPKIKKPLFRTHEVETYNPKLGVVKLKDNKKFRVDKIKQYRRFAITDA